NTSRRRCLPGGTAPRCSPRRAVLPAQCGSSLRPNTASASPGGCRGQASRAYQRRKRISVSSSLLGGYDEPEILRSSSYQICLTGAEAGHAKLNSLHRSLRVRGEIAHTGGQLSTETTKHPCRGLGKASRKQGCGDTDPDKDCQRRVEKRDRVVGHDIVDVRGECEVDCREKAKRADFWLRHDEA